MVVFAGATAARIGEVCGVRAEDINEHTWLWTVRRQTPGPGGLIDKVLGQKVIAAGPALSPRVA